MSLLVYESRDYGILISYPINWECKENFMGTTVIFLSPQEDISDQFRENLNIMVQDLTVQPMNLEEYTELSLAQLDQLISKFKLTEPVFNSTLAGYPAKTIKYTGRQGKLKLKWYTIYTIFDNTAYILTCTGNQKSFESYLPYFNEMINSFQIL